MKTIPSVTAGRGGTIAFCILVFFGGISCGDAPFSKAEGGPNVILISIDTLRADHIHGYGYERETTPNLDKLMERGTFFSNAISQSPWTLPSIA